MTEAGKETVRLVGDVKLRFGCSKIVVEEPVEIRAGSYDIRRVGAYTFLGGENSVIRHVESIGRFCMIGPGAQFGIPQHPGDHLSAHIIFEFNAINTFPSEQVRRYWDRNESLAAAAQAKWIASKNLHRISIGNDVWIGRGVTIMRGCRIGDGAIIAASSVVTKDVEPYSIVGGVPAKVLRWRFDELQRFDLQRLEWWKYDLSVMDGVDVADIAAGIAKIKANIQAGVRPYSPKLSALRGATPRVTDFLEHAAVLES
ncbi:hypothetical protein EV130_11190 [Rhizobium azibense]|uniref:Transferase family hexapeptide repeat protein n=1 Tax=Rhizobium azibense TaxID=1136135 RepID=A0A4R3QHH8_9HYPH|nr:CatB-related O-acetyltransferase [Rhizobium azibense]TCU21233.1 hypothetical protein EV130_11190 [Rhizobium azibense]